MASWHLCRWPSWSAVQQRQDHRKSTQPNCNCSPTGSGYWEWPSVLWIYSTQYEHTYKHSTIHVHSWLYKLLNWITILSQLQYKSFKYDYIQIEIHSKLTCVTAMWWSSCYMLCLRIITFLSISLIDNNICWLFIDQENWYQTSTKMYA